MNYQEYQKHEKDATQEWCVVVGGAYRKVPALVVETMCEEGENVAWVKKDLTLPVKRECDHLVWLSDKKLFGGRCGVSWVPGRGVRGWSGAWGRGMRVLTFFLVDDHDVLAKCQSARPGELPKLESLYSGDELRSTSPSGPAPS